MATLSSSSSSSSMFLRLFLSNSLIFFFILWSLKKTHGLERRETSETHYHTVQITSLLPDSVCNPSAKGPSKSASSLRLVHRYGPCSQDNTNGPTLTQILTHDQSRVNSIQSRLAFTAGRNNLQDSKVDLPAKRGSSLGTANYIVTVGLGTPKRDLSLVFDTGSDLTWTQCEPCTGFCYKQQQPTFDPTKSTTYSNITCNTPLCSQLTSATGNQPICRASTCVYGIQYGDKSFSIGYFGKEKLTLSTTDVFDNFLFGCGQNNRGLFGSTAGLLGLGRDRLSIVSQTAQKYGKYFSYCLPSSSGSTGHLTFGNNGVQANVKFTPLSSSQGTSFYYIDITGISVGGQQLSISPTVFKTAGALIDSGTVITRLPPAAYAPLRAAFRQGMAKYPLTNANSILDTCYDFSSYTTGNILIPKISFFFNGNVKVDIDSSGIFFGTSVSQVCLAFAGNSDDSNIAIFGNTQQKTLEVVYDVAGGKLGFGPGGCS